jgi:hypothetical protein
MPNYASSESDYSDSEISDISSESDESDQESEQLIFDEGYESDCESYHINQLRIKPKLQDTSSTLTVSGVLRYAKKNTFVL